MPPRESDPMKLMLQARGWVAFQKPLQLDDCEGKKQHKQSMKSPQHSWTSTRVRLVWPCWVPQLETTPKVEENDWNTKLSTGIQRPPSSEQPCNSYIICA